MSSSLAIQLVRLEHLHDAARAWGEVEKHDGALDEGVRGRVDVRNERGTGGAKHSGPRHAFLHASFCISEAIPSPMQCRSDIAALTQHSDDLHLKSYSSPQD